VEAVTGKAFPSELIKRSTSGESVMGRSFMVAR
jgi:hypothetical protein